MNAPEEAVAIQATVSAAVASAWPQTVDVAGNWLAADARPAGERGRTTVSKAAVERIAARVIAECPDVGGTARRVLGVSAGEAEGRDAAVTARLHGTVAVSLAVRCSVPYPRPVTRATENLREMLTGQVGELTGLSVRRVDITVTELTTPARGARRVE
jgi:uncharacterized alkaline shock family protein YloU